MHAWVSHHSKNIANLTINHTLLLHPFQECIANIIYRCEVFWKTLCTSSTSQYKFLLFAQDIHQTCKLFGSWAWG